MRTTRTQKERFIEAASLEEDMDFSLEESTYLKMIKLVN